MSKKINKLCLSLALAAVVGVSAGAAACGTSKHPNARITIEFNEKTYVIDYMLYRNMYPQTVQHFVELADSGFYNDIIVHNYTSSDWITGAYSYNAKDATSGEVIIDYSTAFTNSAMAEYLEKNCKEVEYYNLVNNGIAEGKFSASVYKRSVYDGKGNEVVSASDALPTVIGEFSANGHKIEDDKGLAAEFGTLKMFYYSKDAGTKVTVKNSFDQILPRDYNYNCATSLFTIQAGDYTSFDASKYAVFGRLKNDNSKDNLQDLTDAITDYSNSLSSSSKWSTSVATKVDKEDKFADEGGRDIDQTFTMTTMPLIIRSVKITKY